MKAVAMCDGRRGGEERGHVYQQASLLPLRCIIANAEIEICVTRTLQSELLENDRLRDSLLQ